MSSHLTPLEVCERIIGGIETVATACGLHPKSAYGWRHASGLRQAGDLPSVTAQRSILAYCKARGLPMQPHWLILGATLAEVRAAMAEHAAHRAA